MRIVKTCELKEARFACSGGLENDRWFDRGDESAVEEVEQIAHPRSRWFQQTGSLQEDRGPRQHAHPIALSRQRRIVGVRQDVSGRLESPAAGFVDAAGQGKENVDL